MYEHRLRIGACGYSFCVAVDELPSRNLVPLVLAVTSDVVYLHLHGCNLNWFGARGKQRYGRLSSGEELTHIIPAIRQMADKARRMLIVNNSCHREQAVRNARDLQDLPFSTERQQG